MSAPNDKELVLLVEGDAFRPVIVDPSKHVTTIIEREHFAVDLRNERIWICKDDERALTGQRIFRELLTPLPPAPSEKPMFDELVIKKPLPFTWES